jgi:uncharacterized repeat protein (TIGR01451 family)
MQMAGANEHPRIEGEDLLSGKSNYFIGNDPSKWRTNVPQFAKVRIADIYRGIDEVYYGNQQQLEYDLVIRPGADPRQIRLVFQGAERIEIYPSGDLALYVNGGVLRHLRPAVYQQDSNGLRHPVAARYRQRDANEFGVDLGAYNAARPLIIDPVLVYSTYLGGSSADSAQAIAVDASGNAYVAGDTVSTTFPTMKPLQAANCGSSDAFVAKMKASGSALVYSTYLGGGSDDNAYAIAVDASGNAFVAGYTVSTNFPTMNPLQAAKSGPYDAFVAKLNAAGSALVYSTYLGGSSFDLAYAIALDTSGNAYVAGYTASKNFPTMNPLQAANFGADDVFVAKLNAAGSALVYSTYLGGSSSDVANGIAVDASGNAYVAGYTDSTDFLTKNPLQAAEGGFIDAFVAKLNAAGSALVYSTYLGGSRDDLAHAIAVNASGDAYVVGYTDSTNFPTTNALQAANGGAPDAFVAKLNAAGSVLVYSTYLGGSSDDGASEIAVDASENAYIAGVTGSTNFPTMNPIQAANGGGSDAFVAKLNAAGSALVYSTYLGGNGNDYANAIAVNASGNAYVAGYTASTNFPTMNALQTANGGGSSDAFVAMISEAAYLSITKAASDPPYGTGLPITYTIAVHNAGPAAAADVVMTDTIPPGTTFISETPSQGSCSGTSTTTCTLGVIASGGSATISLEVNLPPNATTVSNTATVSSSNPDPDQTNNTASASVVVIPSAAIPVSSWYAMMLLAAAITAIAFARLQR